MTDKEQIIIDGCNVSKCRFYEEGLCKALDAFKQTEYDFVFCNEYKNCACSIAGRICNSA